MTNTRPRRSGGSQFRRRKNNASQNNRRRYSSSSSRTRTRTSKRRQMPSFDPTQFINRNPVEVAEEVYVPKSQFSALPLTATLKKAIKTMGLIDPTPIQDQVIPEILQGKDVVGLAETGTGKTAAFLIPMIERKLSDNQKTTLILTPTRELAIQIENELRLLSKGFPMYSTVCVGGTSIAPQIRGLKRKNQFIIGTPGRVKDLIDRRLMPLKTIDSVILDEADRMLDMGFIHDMRYILDLLPPKRQTLFFSATMDDKTAGLIKDFMDNPVTVSVKKKAVTDSIEQDVVSYIGDQKFDTLLELLKKDELRRVIIFGAMKHQVERIGSQINQNGITAESIHGNKSHSQRQRALKRFKSGQAKVLVATDVAARGIHVDSVSHVINYDLPNTFEDYVHRIGRTGRGKERGKALTFIPATN